MTSVWSVMGAAVSAVGPVPSKPVIRLDAATVLLQWATGMMAFCWFTTRRREVGVGYGWTIRGTSLILGIGAAVAGFRYGTVAVREISTLAFIVTTFTALAVSYARRRAGVSGQQAEHDRRSQRVAAMTGIERDGRSSTTSRPDQSAAGPEFPPILDLIPAFVGVIGLLAAAWDAAPHDAYDVSVSVLRTIVGALFLGSISDAMLLGHWYLVQPGLPRRLLNELVDAVGWIWPIEVVSLLLPTGMFSVWTGAVDDGWNGTLGWFWGASAVTTIVLVFVTKAALKEREYSAVMAATGLLYLAILTAFGTDLVARAILSAG